MTITYAMTASLLFIGLALMLIDVSHKLKDSEHRRISLILIGTSMFYVAMDCLWIIVYTGESFNRGAFVILNFLFYLVYITLPYIWFLFSSHFAGGKPISKRLHLFISVPWFFNLALVLLTMFGTGLLWEIGDAANRYTRGPLFGVFSNLNLVYYFFAVFRILALLFTNKGADRRTLITTLGFSMIPALGVFIYTYWISVDAIYPFQPCCFFIGVMFAYILLLSHVYKQSADENLRLSEQAKSAGRLAELMGSVGALLTNMPAMTFSKDVSTGLYLACNQSFAEYAHRENPEAVVGLTDHDIFDPVTADHFVEDDKKATAMKEPYVFFEDVPDAAGVMRNLQTTKLTFHDSTGRLCLLGMCVDVTEMTRIKQAEAEGRIRQQELEEKLALQEQILQQEEQQKELNSMITAMASDYRSVYHVDIDTDDAVCYRADPHDPDHVTEGLHFPYLKTFTDYCERHVDESFQEGFLKFIDPDNIRGVLEHENIMAFRYLARRNGTEYYEMLRMAGVRHPGDRDDHIVHAVGVGFTVIDAEMRETMARSRALAEALSAAENANKAKSAFLSNMSHEIRTPMNAIIGLNSIALNEPSASDKVKEHLRKIDSSAHHLLGIINDILDMSRIESGRVVLRNEQFSFAGMLAQVNTMIGGQCRDKGLAYNFHINGHVDDYYVGDDMKLRQVLINILGNAVKFTPKGGSVTFTVEETARFVGKSTLRFIISDTGIGMSPEFLPKLFDPFSQEDSSTTSTYGSTGLGMSITKNIVELMNGHIDVESEKGRGSTFTVTLTLLTGTASDNAGQPISAEESGKLQETSRLKGRRMLLAEDVDVNAEIVMMLLSMHDMEADLAENGKIAVDRFTEHEAGYYAAILMDMRMPVMDGLSAAKAIRAMDRPDAKTIPIIALTANAFDEDVQRSMQAGLNAHLSKPVEPDALFQTLERLIK